MFIVSLVYYEVGIILGLHIKIMFFQRRPSQHRIIQSVVRRRILYFQIEINLSDVSRYYTELKLIITSISYSLTI